MRNNIFLPLWIIFCCVIQSVQAAPEVIDDKHIHDAPDVPMDISFIKNEGQWDHPGKFRADIPGGVMFLSDKGFVYSFTSSEDLDKLHDLTCGKEPAEMPEVTLNHHAYFVNFVGANLDPSYEPTDKRTYYHNYFIGNDQSSWKGGVGLFGRVEQQNIYDGIDLSVYSKGRTVKYDFVVAPGADPAQIKLEFEGVEPYVNQEGDLRIKTTVNEVVERAPYTYQVINGKEVEVPSEYTLEDGVLSFVFPEGYNEDYPLIIDPDLIFATYTTGTSGAYYSYSTTYDDAGNFYVGSGALSGASGWPVTTGAFQSTTAGGYWEVAINKYNEIGTAIIYSTYYGGSNRDVAHSMFVNDQDELIIAGSTNSANLPTTTGCYDSTLNGSYDIYIAHFNSTGTDLVGATYIGTSTQEPYTVSLTGQNTGLDNQNMTSPVELAVDTGGNIWVVSNTTAADFPVTTNALQSTSGGGMDGVFFQLDPTCSDLMYSSYLGGTGLDAIYSLVFDNSGKLVMGGPTQSSDFPTTAGVLNATAPGGSFDGFVSIYDPVTNALTASTYIGTSGMDQVVSLQLSVSNEVFILGRTDGPYPISPGVYNLPDGDVFIDRLSADLSSSILSTRIGTDQNTTTRYFPTSFLLDMCGNVYVAGLGGSSTGTSGGQELPGTLPVTPDALLSTPSYFWFIVLKPNYSDILFGSFYGSGSTTSDHTHVGLNRMDPNGVVYQSICSSSPTYPTTPGVVGPDKLSTGQDVVSFKVDFQATGVKSAIALDPGQNDSICAPGSVVFDNESTSPYPIDYVWDFGDGNTSTQATPTHTYNVPGVYEVVLHAHSDSACITDSWDTFQVTVLQTELPEIVTQDTIICSDENAVDLTVAINNPSANNTIQWGPSSGIVSGADQSTVTVDPSVNTLYYVTVKDTIPGVCGFSVTDTVAIDFMPRALDILTSDTAVCQGALVQVVAQALPGYSFHWAPSTGVSDTNALNPVISVNQSETYTLTASYPGCPDTSQTLSVEMQAYPVVDLGPDKEVCQWQEISLESNVTPFRNDYTYSWTPAEGLSTPDGPNVEYMADTSGTYTLQVETPIGCSGTDTINVLVHPGAFGDIMADTGFCPPGEIPLWATGGTEYLWEPAYGLDNPNVANPLASPETSTSYTVFITNEHNCVDTESVVIELYPLAVINLPDSVTVYPGEEYHLQPGTNAHYFNWFPTNGINSTSAADPIFNPTVRTRYFVTATTENGCSVIDSMDVLVEQTVIDMPNAFVPGRGNNTVFKPAKRGIVTLQEFSVYNRWGNKVFTTTAIDEGWDGTYNGEPQPMGVYIYVIRAVTDSGQQFRQEGDVTLIR